MSIAISPLVLQANLLAQKQVQINPILQVKSKPQQNISFTSNLAQVQAQKATTLAQNKNFIHCSDKTPLGANYNKKTNEVEFKLASKSASAVVLCLFDNPKGEQATKNIQMQKNKEGIWQANVSLNELGEGKKPVYYGYRVFSENWNYSDKFFDENGNVANPKAGFKTKVGKGGERANPNKIAYDPYSKELSHLPSDNPQGESVYFSDKKYFEDNSTYAPKSVFYIGEDFIMPKVKPRALSDEIIGEVHVKDLSINEDVEGAGTYLGAKNTAKKVKELGFTMVEFLPLCEFDDKEGVGNHWGYMTLNYFAPAKKYSSDKTAGGALREFREMVKAFHNEDIKVCMDVVYNHTGEAGLKGKDKNAAKQISYSLIDNPTYYKQKDGIYNSNSGCGNDMNVAQDEVMNLVADSVAFWAKQGVDAFRFDLGVGLMDIDPTENVNYDPQKSLVGKMSKMLEARGVKVNKPNEAGDGIYLIAEPWTCGGNYSYQLGRFPDEWAQWNDRAREAYKKDSNNPFALTPQDLRNTLEGSKQVLNSASKSINYSHSHDGFSLNDSNSYAKSGFHHATNYGGNLLRQEGAMKKQIALNLLSKGTSMLQIGDVIAHSKGGDDNSYNKDDGTNYLDFSKTEVENSREARILDFSKKMMEFRKAHKCLRDEAYNSNIQYFKPDGSIAHDWDESYWKNVNSNIMCYKINDINSLFVSTSSDEHFIDVKLPAPKEGKTWHLVCDSARESSFADEQNNSGKFVQSPHSVVIFEEK